MPKSIKCRIQFMGNAERIYHAGETIKVRVDLTVEKPKYINAIYAHIEGKSFCKWANDSKVIDDQLTEIDPNRINNNPNNGNNNNKTMYKREELYFSELILLYGGPFVIRNFRIRIAPGIYSYTFECKLPNVMLPSSFEADIGFIRYNVRIKMERPWLWDLCFEKRFTVIKPLDLTNSYLLRKPIELLITVNLNLLRYLFNCINNNKGLTMQMKLSQTAYIPGQTITTDVMIINNTAKNLNQILVRIIQIIQYSTFRNSATHTKNEVVVAETKVNGCKPYSKIESQKIDLIVPKVPPTDTVTSDIFKIQYELRVLVEINKLFWYFNKPRLSVPICIGTSMNNSPERASIGWRSEYSS